MADARRVDLGAYLSIVSEGYLGAHLAQAPDAATLAQLHRELLALYRDTLANFARQLPSGSEVSICAPAWRIARRWSYLGIVDDMPRLGYTLKRFTHVRTPLLYARNDQTVGRQFLLLRKI